MNKSLSVNGIVLCNGLLNTNGNLTLLSTASAQRSSMEAGVVKLQEM